LFIANWELQIPHDGWPKQHPTTLRSKTYSVAKLANVIWGEDWDVGYFVNNWTKISFQKVIHDMYESSGTKNYSTHCAHNDGASSQLDYTLWLLSKASIDSL
jgi:hypothetical protein